MKKILFLCLIALGFIFSSCATIAYGPQYTAKVVVKNHQNTSIYVNNVYYGIDSVSFQWMRKNADNLTITLKEENYKDQVFKYNTKSIKGWTIVGNFLVVGWLPGILIDGITGSWYKPDTSAASISQIGLDNDLFLYELIYNRCPIKKDD